MKSMTKKRNLILTLLAVCITSLVLACLPIILAVTEKTEVYAEPEQTYDIHSSDDFVAYARAYAAGDRNPKDVLNISISSGSDITDDTFISLGTSARPFAGTLIIPTAGVDTFRLYNCPLFDYVSTDMQITGAGTVKIIREKASDTPAVGVLTSGALFANHVVAGDHDASWSVALLPYSGEGEAATEHGGVVGDIAANAEVSVSFTNTSNLNVSGSGDTGLVCGNLGAGATLSVSTAGSGSAISVTSTGGNVGGLVGTMGAGATVTLNSANNSRVTAVTSNAGYAGGIVGEVKGVTATTNGILLGVGVTDYAVSGSVTGTTGAGGLFGYYKDGVAAATFDLLDTFAIASDMTISSSGYTGGVFGLLENGGGSFTFDGNKGAETVRVTLSGGSSRGGVCGGYKASALTDSLILYNVKTQVTASTSSGNDLSGGLIGTVVGNAAYISVYDTYTVSSGSMDGGLIGNLGETGSFVDLSSTNKVEGTFDAGLIGNMPQGVLRIAGTTDFSAYTKVDWASGLIAKTRGRALIYATGDGEGNGWTLKRNTANTIDDVRSWGEVLRTDGTILSAGDLFTVDMTAHTVTVNGAATTMNNVTDFAKTALNIQLNTGAGVGALQFTSGSANLSSTLLSGTLTLGANISLSSTGLTGLTRDDGNNEVFSGTFNGGNKTLTLATGERYGLDGSGNALSANSNQGNVYRHKYNGLFAEIDGATIQNLTVAGNVILYQSENGMMAGGVAAFASGTDNAFTNVTANFTLTYRTSGDYDFRFGGAIGEVRDVAAITVTDCTFTPTVNDITANDVTGDTNISYIGGAIGYISAGDTASPSQTVTFQGDSSHTALGLTYTKTVNTARESCFGGVIAKIGNAAYVKDNRQIIIKDGTTVNVTATGTVANNHFGGILGYSWLASDVTIEKTGGSPQGLTVTASVTATGSATLFGGLTQTATGKWDIQKITLSSASYTLPYGNSSSFGFVANKTFTNERVNGVIRESALYLDIDNENYDISALTFTGSPSFGYFDEIVANSKGTGNDLVDNGNSIISITTSGNAIDTSGSTYNTYLNKTTYGKNAAASHKINGHTRYYYNLAYARANTATAKYQFLVWSVKIYAHSSLSAWFVAGNSFSGSLDMTGLSYYPVDLTENVMFTNAAITLDNILMEAAVKYAYSGEAGSRSTRTNDNQHYLMHTAVFRNAKAGNITVTATSDGLKLSGNVPNLSGNFCGFLVAGTLGGSDSRNVKFNASKIVFDGAHIVTNSGADIVNTDYAPLLINKVGKNVSLTLSAAEQSDSAYSGYNAGGKYAGSSLIGDVGSSTARAIYLTFTGLKFDGRSSAANIGNLNDVYGTDKSIFSRATILNSFLYAGESSGSYNFEIDEDWTNSTTAIHEVTYGKEITSSSENADKQKKYSGSTYYVHPTSYQSESPYDFSTGFLPYVYVAYNLSEYKHELSVNVTVTSEIEGCGKYGDPFVIDDDDKLPILSQIIAADNLSSLNTVKLYLPSGYASCVYTGVEETDYTKSEYTFGNFTASQIEDVRKYLAGAYYVITRDITLSDDYIALGTVTSAEYAFRGVIVGRGDPTVTNNSRNPLIKTSLGCVVKDITVDVQVTYNSSNVIELAAPTGSATYDYSGSGSIQAYGAVIGQILGGDTFIDDVQVTFTDVSFSITAATASNYPRLTPIGGYVGALVNGGLIFRNMTAANVGLTDAKSGNKISDAGYLYVNPIIGRVIAGYAFHETENYAVTSATLNNGEKNYTISDLSLSAGQLNVTYSSATAFNITVPDGQAMFVLGAIVNSGAASADYHASTVNVYQDLTDFWSAYRAHTTARAGAAYSGVGTASGDDYTAACLDAYTSDGAKIPYIIRAYTNKTTTTIDDAEYTVYLARCISTTTANVVTVTGNCNVAAGFRGIGSIYYNSSYLRLGISKMTGQIDSTQDAYQITLNMRYLEYNHNALITATSPYTASPYIAFADNTGSGAGFGLFNKLEISGASSSNSVNYLKLSGRIFYDVYKIDDGTQAGYKYANSKVASGTVTTDNDADRPDYAAKLGTGDETNGRTILSVGGIAGVINSKFYISNVTFNDLEVEGAKTAGGLVGLVFINDTANQVSTIDYTAGITNAGYVDVVGGQCAGGLIGRIYRAAVVITGASGGTDIIIKNIASKNTVPNETGLKYYANMTTGVGGLIGNCWGKDRKSNKGGDDVGDTVFSGNSSRKLHISNVNVVKGTSAANVIVRNDADSYNNYAGGFVGSAHNVWLQITDSKVIGVNVTANAAGGFVGKVSQKYYLYISGCSADGNDKTVSVSGTRYAGGAVGWAIGRDTLYFQLLNFNIKGYVMQSTTTGSIQAGAGGLVGYAQGDNKSVTADTNFICEFNNLTVNNCDIKTNYTNKTDNYINYKCGTGGIIGVIDVATDGVENTSRSSTNKYKFSGYNICIKDCTLSHKNGGSSDDSTSATNRRIGDVVGNNAISTTLKFVGLSVQNTGYADGGENKFCGKHVGYWGSTSNNYGSDSKFGTGYIVFANYNAQDENVTFTGLEDDSDDSDNYTDVAPAYSYITVNPAITFGGITLTGDGVADSEANLPIKTILADESGLYDAAGAYYTGSSGDNNKQTFNAYTGKLVMFTSEVSGYLDTDFPVLILDDTTKANSHKMINSYLRLLTNTRHDFGIDGAGEYAVKIYNVTYSDDAFVISASGASLKRNEGQFYMTNNAFDSGKIQFSLIDVRFFNPADTSKVAYHLYVPVFVKKVLSYNFNVAVQSGTNYSSSHYTGEYGEALIENVGTPVTLYFEYGYSKADEDAGNIRTKSEWTAAINAGENVNRNYAKRLLFYKANTNDVLKEFPSGTVLVLVDPNRGGKPYYATIGTALSGNTLNLGAFRETMPSVGVFGGEYFTPVNLDKLMTFSVTTVGDGTDKMVACDAAYATVMVGNQGYRLATEEELKDNEVTKVTVTVTAMSVEKYYLSILTESNAENDLLFHYYLIQSQTAFTETAYPSKIADTGAHTMVHLVMGKIFYHGGFSVSSTSELGTTVMSETNNELTVNLTSELGLSDELDADIKSNMQSLISATDVYQSFLVYLNRKEGDEVSKVILGSPAVSGSYSIDSGDATAYGVGSIRSTQNHVEVVTGDLSGNFATGNNFEINATITLSYSGAGILSQFPGRSTTMPDNGVTVSGSSNIAFSSNGTTYSKNTVGGDETPAKSYYSEAESVVAVLDLNPIGDKVGDFTPLGINALNNGNATSAEFDLLGVINATSVEEQIGEYASVNIKIRLSQKQEDGSYSGIDNISPYFMSSEDLYPVSFEGVGAATYHTSYYSITFNKDKVSDNGAEITLPVMHFNVITGSALESAGLAYGNYRVDVDVVLCNSLGAEIGTSKVSNYIIYTNAKTDPSFLA